MSQFLRMIGLKPAKQHAVSVSVRVQFPLEVGGGFTLLTVTPAQQPTLTVQTVLLQALSICQSTNTQLLSVKEFGLIDTKQHDNASSSSSDTRRAMTNSSSSNNSNGGGASKVFLQPDSLLADVLDCYTPNAAPHMLDLARLRPAKRQQFAAAQAAADAANIDQAGSQSAASLDARRRALAALQAGAKRPVQHTLRVTYPRTVISLDARGKEQSTIVMEQRSTLHIDQQLQSVTGIAGTASQQAPLNNNPFTLPFADLTPEQAHERYALLRQLKSVRPPVCALPQPMMCMLRPHNASASTAATAALHVTPESNVRHLKSNNANPNAATSTTTTASASPDKSKAERKADKLQQKQLDTEFASIQALLTSLCNKQIGDESLLLLANASASNADDTTNAAALSATQSEKDKEKQRIRNSMLTNSKDQNKDDQDEDERENDDASSSSGDKLTMHSIGGAATTRPLKGAPERTPEIVLLFCPTRAPSSTATASTKSDTADKKKDATHNAVVVTNQRCVQIESGFIVTEVKFAQGAPLQVVSVRRRMRIKASQLQAATDAQTATTKDKKKDKAAAAAAAAAVSYAGAQFKLCVRKLKTDAVNCTASSEDESDIEPMQQHDSDSENNNNNDDDDKRQQQQQNENSKTHHNNSSNNSSNRQSYTQHAFDVPNQQCASYIQQYCLYVQQHYTLTLQLHALDTHLNQTLIDNTYRHSLAGWTAVMKSFVGPTLFGPTRTPVYEREIKKVLRTVELMDFTDKGLKINSVKLVEFHLPHMTLDRAGNEHASAQHFIPSLQLRSWLPHPQHVYCFDLYCNLPSFYIKIAIQGKKYFDFDLQLEVRGVELSGSVLLRSSPYTPSQIAIRFESVPQLLFGVRSHVLVGSVKLPFQKSIERLLTEQLQVQIEAALQARCVLQWMHVSYEKSALALLLERWNSIRAYPFQFDSSDDPEMQGLALVIATQAEYMLKQVLKEMLSIRHRIGALMGVTREAVPNSGKQGPWKIDKEEQLELSDSEVERQRDKESEMNKRIAKENRRAQKEANSRQQTRDNSRERIASGDKSQKRKDKSKDEPAANVATDKIKSPSSGGGKKKSDKDQLDVKRSENRSESATPRTEKAKSKKKRKDSSSDED